MPEETNSSGDLRPDHFELPSVSAINAGIAGDSMYGMEKRVYRDVVRHQPDLVIINGFLS